jgi:hypothetical protein
MRALFGVLHRLDVCSSLISANLLACAKARRTPTSGQDGPGRGLTRVPGYRRVFAALGDGQAIVVDGDHIMY